MRISIITATFNSASTLKDTFESILSQTYKDIECIVVDGASKDITVDIIREYEPRFNGRMKWISEPDHGIYDAMNKGLSMAKGEIVGILNSDDFYSSDNILQIIAEQIRDEDAVYGDVHYVDPQNLKEPVRYYSSKSFKPWQMRLGFMPAHPSFYCRRYIYQKFGNFDTSFKIAADFEQLLRFIFVNKIKIKYIPIDFVTMRTGGASTSGISSHLNIIRDHIRAYKKNKVHSNIFLESLRYPCKIVQIMKFKFKKNIHPNNFMFDGSRVTSNFRC